MRKKGLIKLAACTLVLAMALSLGACSDSSKDDKDKDTDRKTSVENNDVDDDDNEDEDDNKNSSGKFESMEEYLADPTVSSQLDTLKSTMEDSDMKMEIKGEDNKLIYTYQFKDLVKEEGMEEMLESEAAKQESTFVSTATGLKSVVAVDNPVVVIDYLESTGEMIFTKEYAAE